MNTLTVDDVVTELNRRIAGQRTMLPTCSEENFEFFRNNIRSYERVIEWIEANK